MAETYLGDGLYASFDGFQYQLRAPRLGIDHHVFLDPDTLEAFLKYAGIQKDKTLEVLEDIVRDSRWCGDNSCIFHKPPEGALGTNGGCRCFTNRGEMQILKTRVASALDKARKQ